MYPSIDRRMKRITVLDDDQNVVKEYKLNNRGSLEYKFPKKRPRNLLFLLAQPTESTESFSPSLPENPRKEIVLCEQDNDMVPMNLFDPCNSYTHINNLGLADEPTFLNDFSPLSTSANEFVDLRTDIYEHNFDKLETYFEID